ncbi:unnamed protein product [Colias eurytheme]|nr:unnamed protein product [Colias eurytheme]
MVIFEKASVEVTHKNNMFIERRKRVKSTVKRRKEINTKKREGISKEEGEEMLWKLSSPEDLSEHTEIKESLSAALIFRDILIYNIN